MRLARGAQSLLDMRLAGKRPSARVEIIVGRWPRFGEIGYEPGCDWRCVADLDVTLIVTKGEARKAIEDIAPFAANLAVWREDAKQGVDVFAFAKPADPTRFKRELDATKDAEIAAFDRRWFPEWAHPDLWRWTAKVLPWRATDNEAWSCN